MNASRSQWAWALYDWANSAFATTVMAGFFPLFFKQYWSAGVEPTLSTLRLGTTNALASLAVALSAPVLGALADGLGRRKAYLLRFAGLGIAATLALWGIEQGQWQLAALCYGLAVLGFSGGNLFYDALLVSVAREDDLDTLSARGYALGYLGGGLLFALNVAMARWPQAFGLADTATAVRLSFLSVGLWWALFSLPLLLWVTDAPPLARPDRPHPLRTALRQIRERLADLRPHRDAAWFLLAYWLYIDGVDTIVRMAVDYGLSIGLAAGHLIAALLITQFIGFPAALVFGRIGRRLGPRRGIFIALGAYLVITLWAARMDSALEFYLLATGVGLVQGGIQALSRSLFARLVPGGAQAEFFGFYNLLGKFAAVLGPLLVGWVGWLSGEPRLGLLSVLVLFLGGGLLLLKVPEARIAGAGDARP